MWRVLLIISTLLLIHAAESETALAERAVRKGSDEFRAGRIENSLKSFEEAIQHRPEIKPHLWQLGIAYYYAGRFADGRDLFQQHQT